MTVTSRHRRFSIKKFFFKSSQNKQETSVLEPLFKNVAGLKACNFIKKRSQHRCFPISIAKFLMLLFDFFDGSLLHSSKSSRCRLYEGVKLQGLSHRSSFLSLSCREPSPIPRHAFENLRRISLISKLSFYTGYFWFYYLFLVLGRF